MKPLMVEIITYAPTEYFHCKHCEVVWNQADIQGVKKFHADARETSMPAEMMQEYRLLSTWILDAVERYDGRVVFKVVDAASLEGVWKSLRYRVRTYPAAIVGGKEKQIGMDFSKTEALIDRRLSLQAAA